LSFEFWVLGFGFWVAVGRQVRRSDVGVPPVIGEEVLRFPWRLIATQNSKLKTQNPKLHDALEWKRILPIQLMQRVGLA
jgi:hypothetical protein